MPQACAALRCSKRRNAQNKEHGITFHKFPKDPGLRKAWTIAVRRKDFLPNNTTVLCSCHFKAEDLDKTGQIVRLREGVIPSVFASIPDNRNKLPKKARSTRTSRKAADDPVCESPEPLNLSTSLPKKARSTRTSRKAAEKNDDPVCESPEPLNLSTSALDETRSTRPSQKNAKANDDPVPVLKSPEPLNFSTSDHHYALDPDQVKIKLAEARARVELLEKQLRNARDRERRRKRTVRSPPSNGSLSDCSGDGPG